VSWLVANTLVAAAAALAALAVGRWLRPAPAAMHLLWLFVLLKLVTPPLLTIEVPLAPLAPAPVRTAPWTAPERSHGAAAGAGSRPALAAAGATPAATPAAAPASVQRVDVAAIALAVWAAGAAVMLARLAAGLARGRRRMRGLASVSAAARAEVEALAARLGVRAPELRDDPDASSPYVWSIGRPVLVLPVQLLARAPANGRAAVLAHELAHLRRGDPWFLRLELALGVALWWHPLFWLACRQMRAWSELACDAWALASVPGASLDYATVLVDAVSRPDRVVAATAVLAARPAARAVFERRLTMILDENVPHRPGRRAWWSAAGLAVALFTVPVAAQREQDPVRVEVRVDGKVKSVDELTASERKALLRSLLRAEEQREVRDAPRPRPRPEPAPKPRGKADPDGEPRPKPQGEPRPKSGRAAPEHAHGEEARLDRHDAHQHMKAVHRGIHQHVHDALREAHVEIEADPDLRELGITDEVSRLVEDVAGGKGIDGGLDELIRAAMRGASRMTLKELEADPELRELGLTEDVVELVQGLMNDRGNQDAIGAFVRKAARAALGEARRDIERDPELKRLGIDVDVGELIDGVLRGGGSFDADLQRVIDKAIHGAMRLHDNGEHGDAPAPARKKARPGARTWEWLSDDDDEQADEPKPAPPKNVKNKSVLR
jgi:beta-lactamase regulating signal transducer with metallopeptidase domain